MSWRDKIRKLFRFFFLFTVLFTVALISAITTIRLTIHGRQEKLPSLIGQPVQQAQQTLTALGLALKVEDRLYSNNIPLGEIVSQIPSPDTAIKPGQHVHVLVSLGPPQVTLPNVVGSSIRAARITAIQQGLTIGDIASLYWPGSEPDEVVGQDPPPSTSDLRTPAVDFLVSLGDPPPAYLCPSFIGKPLGTARRELESAGFRNVQVTSLLSPGTASGTVLKQIPIPGSKITPDMVCNLQIAQ